MGPRIVPRIVERCDPLGRIMDSVVVQWFLAELEREEEEAKAEVQIEREEQVRLDIDTEREMEIERASWEFEAEVAWDAAHMGDSD